MLNERAKAILVFIQKFTRETGYPPTIREIGVEFGIASTNGVRYYLNLLEKHGHLKRSGKISRGIVNITAHSGPGIRILGRVAAGQPITAEECYEGTLDPGDCFGRTNELFALKVRGDSMEGAGILDGDYVVVRRQDHANPGEMVVALVGTEATVKYYRPKGDQAELMPANPRHHPMIVDRTSEFQIAGIVKGVLRTLGR